MNKNLSLSSIVGLCTLLVFAIGQPVQVQGKECEDLVSSEKWNSEGHGDNNPSENKFEDMLEGTATLCEMAEAIDHMEVRGEVDDWTDLKETMVFQTAYEEQQDCLKERFDLPDGGEKALQAYEIMDCATGDY